MAGPKNKNLHSFTNCLDSVKRTIENKINAPVELRDKEIYAFSFYFDRLNSAKLFGGTYEILNFKNI